MSARRRESLAGYAFLLPWFLGLIFITAGPLIASLALSLTHYDLLTRPEWAGLDNYVRMFTEDKRFWAALSVTVRYVLISVPLQLTFALGLALVLDRGVRGLPFYRSIYYLPSLLGSSVAIAVLWKRVFGDAGLVNSGLALFGIEGPVWIFHPDWALSTLIVLNVWTFGSPMVIFLAGLRQIPREYYEAAAVDGAGPIRRFWNVTLPLLTPVIFLNLVLQIIFAFQAFTPAFIVSGGRGGPADSTLFYTLYIYQQGFGQFNMGYASALAWVLLVLIAVFTAITFFTSRWWVFYGDD